MVITVTLKNSTATHKINVVDEFITNEKGHILSWDKQALKAKEIAHDLYGTKVQNVEFINK